MHTVMLSDLISGGKIWIEVVFPIEGRAALNLRVESEGCADAQFDTFGIEPL